MVVLRAAAAASEKTVTGISLAGQAFFGSLCAGTFGLGVWQTRRYFEKVDIVAARQAALGQEPTSELPQLLVLDSTVDNDPTAVDYAATFRRIQLQGYFLHDYEFLVGPRGAPAGSLPEKRSSSATTTAAPSQQGYFVLTPFVVTNNNMAPTPTKKINESNTNNTNNSNELVVIVNRGWVPRQMAVIPRQSQKQKTQDHVRMNKNDDNNSDNKSNDEQLAPSQQPRLSTVRRTTVRRHEDLLARRRQTEQSINNNINNNNTNNGMMMTYLGWERPLVPPISSLMVVPAPHEKPRFIVPQHENIVVQQRQQQQQQQYHHRTTADGNGNGNVNIASFPPPPPKLFWFDRQAMKQIASSVLSPVQQKMPLLVLTAVKNDDKNDKQQPAVTSSSLSSSSSLWPAVPPASRVGEPKVSPMIHVGYAVTWYGLSAAGIYMTRKLITKGR